MKITLKVNGQTKEAAMLPDGSYEVVMADGSIKIYGSDKIRLVVDEDSGPDPEVLNNKEDAMFHYLQEVAVGEDKVLYRFVTRKLPKKVAAKYELSKAIRRPVQDIMAIETGTWEFSLLEYKFAQKDFTLMAIHNQDLAKYSPAKRQAMLDRSTMAYSNASYTFMLKTDDETWGLDSLDMEIDFAKKSAKRMQEVARLAESFFHAANDDDFKWKIMDFDGTDDMLWDGVSYATVDCVSKAYRNIKNNSRRRRMLASIQKLNNRRKMWRVVGRFGEIKGDLIVVPNGQLGEYDFVTHASNIKMELRSTNDDFHMTVWDHDALHLATYNSQATINFPQVMTEEKEIADINRMVAETRDSLAAGAMPSFLNYGERAHLDEDMGQMERLSESFMRQWETWQYFGGDIKAAQNLVYMGIGGVLNRMMAGDKVYSKYAREWFYRKMWIPMTNAIVAGVVTWESATNMGGFEFPTQMGDRVFFDQRLGLVFPGRRFIDTFDLHGTWDQDDVVTAIVVKLWASGKYQNYIDHKMIPNIILPNKAEEAIEMLAIIRTPNGPGEISFELFDPRGFNFALVELGMYDPNQIVTVDINTVTRAQTEMLEEVEVAGLPETTVYSREVMTKEDSIEMVNAQLSNPGVGRVCNAIMMWASVAPGFPPLMLDVLGNMVDASQQGFDLAQFIAMTEEPDSIYNQVVSYIESHPEVEVDISTAATRMPAAWQKKIADRFVKGRATRVQEAYAGAITIIKTELQNQSLQWRRDSDLVKSLKSITFGADMAKWSMDFYNEFTNKLAVADSANRIPKDASPFVKMNIQHAHKLAMEAVVAEMVARIEQYDDPAARARLVVGLYKWIVRTTPEMKLGRQDRIIFQAAEAGKKSMMHLLLEGINFYAVPRFMEAWVSLIAR